MLLASRLKNLIRPYLSVHKPGKAPSIILTGIPRGGSTWFMEVLGALEGVRMIAEPCNVRVGKIEQARGLSRWSELTDTNRQAALLDYLVRLDRGELRFLNPNPFVQRRFITSRTLYKLIHLPAHIAEQLAEQIGAEFLCLIRHPVPVSLSRKVFPILDDFMDSEYSHRFSPDQLSVAGGVIRGGTHLQRGTLAWCLQYGPYLSSKDALGGRMISYEECVRDTRGVLSQLESLLREPFPEGITGKALAPSRVLSKSDEQTQKILMSKEESSERSWHLIARWKERISKDEANQVQAILDCFQVSAYNACDVMPNQVSKDED